LTCRCGTLVLVIHDFADIFLEAAKLCNYAKLATACDTIFGIFAVSWVITRLGVFPTWILYRWGEKFLYIDRHFLFYFYGKHRQVSDTLQVV
jgi:hypothetical protein